MKTIIVVASVALAAGCMTTRDAAQTAVLRAADGSIWIRSDEISRFRCERGILWCDDGTGRLTQRRCRCTQ